MDWSGPLANLYLWRWKAGEFHNVIPESALRLVWLAYAYNVSIALILI